jgi:hypothetical protein
MTKFLFFVISTDSHIVELFDTEKEVKRILDLETTGMVIRDHQTAILHDDLVMWVDIQKVVTV